MPPESSPQHHHFWTIKHIVSAVLIAVVAVAALIIIKDEVAWQLTGEEYYEDMYAQDDYEPSYSSCNVAKIDLHGDLMTYEGLYGYETGYAVFTLSSDVVASLEAADDSDDVKAIILEIDSAGGDPIAAKEIADALKRIEKPTVALIRSQGLSAGYLSAIGADRIYSSTLSDVGSIAVTMSYLDNSGYNQDSGYVFNSLTSGKFKDLGNPEKALTEGERTIILRDLERMHELVVDMISDYRRMPRETVALLADGSSMLGIDAKEKGLIDGVGDLHDVKTFLASEIGEEVVLCQ